LLDICEKLDSHAVMWGGTLLGIESILSKTNLLEVMQKQLWIRRNSDYMMAMIKK